jgi:hypothetical protein
MSSAIPNKLKKFLLFRGIKDKEQRLVYLNNLLKSAAVTGIESEHNFHYIHTVDSLIYRSTSGAVSSHNELKRIIEMLEREIMEDVILNEK